MPNPVLDQERVAFLAARTVSRHTLVPAWPRSIKELPMVEVEVDWVRFSTLNHRTRAEQLQAVHLSKRPDLFTADPLGKVAQEAQYAILRSQAGFAEIKADLQKRQQQEPAILTAEGVLINGNRRSAALRSLYRDDNRLTARYVQCLVLPEDALPNELVDLEAELQVAQTFKEDYSWVNEAMLIEELYEREGKDFARVGMKMHRKTADVRGLYEKLQQLHQLVAMSKGARLHIDFNENESAFEELSKHIRGKPKTEADSVRATYFLGTLTGVNYRALRHLQRSDAADMVLREIQGDRALQPLLDTIASSKDAPHEADPLDELLGEESQQGDLVSILGFLATKSENDVVKFAGGASASVQEIYSSIQSAVTAAANEAKEEGNDHSAVTAPIVRAENAIGELKRAVAAAPKARRFEEWNERKLQEKITELRALVDGLAQKE